MKPRLGHLSSETTASSRFRRQMAEPRLYAAHPRGGGDHHGSVCCGVTYIVPDDELEIRATRAGGPGGQHVNKVSTRIEVVWDVAGSPSLPPDWKNRLLTRLASKLDTRGRLRVVAADSRSQSRNRDAAVERLRALVTDALRPRKPRKPTRPTAAARERRLREKQRRGQRKRDRRGRDNGE
jgi:ribosome-associated protein